MSARTKVKAVIGAAIFAGYALLSVGCMKAPTPAPLPVPVETQPPQLAR
ncbi:hypothetical protein [Mycobacterium sp. 23]